MRLRAAVVEDEPLAMQLLLRWLAEIDDLDVVGSADNFESASRLISEQALDLLFLDINLSGLDGFSLAESGRREERFEVVFVSAHADYALPAFRVDAADFLKKPFSKAQLIEATERARRRVLARRPTSAAALRLPIRDGDGIQLVAVESIHWIESAGGYSVIHTAAARHVSGEPLAKLLDQLGPGFARIHRSVLVNLDRVESVQSLSHGDALLHLGGGKQLRMSRRYRSAIAQLSEA